MSRGIRLLLVVFLAGIVSGQAQVASRENDNTAPAGFQALFTGKDLTGWKVPRGDNGHWNRFEITVKGDRVSVVLNGIKVIDQAQLPGIAPKGPIGLQHHGSKRSGQWNSPPSLVQFKNIYIKKLK